LAAEKAKRTQVIVVHRGGPTSLTIYAKKLGKISD
jgi:rRNA maturation protein Rpf1